MAVTSGLSLADAGSLYLIASDQIFQLDSEGGIQTIAGRAPDYDVLHLPRSLAFDSAGNLFFADYGNRRVRKITPGGEITTVYEALPERPNVSVRPIEYLAMGPSGSLFLLDPDGRQVVEISADGQVTQTGGPPATDLSGLGADSQGNLYIRDRITNRVWQRNRTGSWSSPMLLRSWGASVASMALVFDPGDQLYAWIDSFAEPGYYKGSLAAGTMVDFRPGVSALAPASGGNVYVADRQSRIWKLSSKSEPQLIAADTTTRAVGEDGIAVAIGCIRAMTLDPAGNLVFSDTCRNRIRMLEGPGDCAPLPAQ
ncbi:MAG: NHL repeat-containing protein [Bryobacterales bacterium]|nr:NHL repeat-containing protein [Bryobacterales bacterium]